MRPTKGESIDACEGGGSSCSSDEVLVMRMERRGCASSRRAKANQITGRSPFSLRRLEVERLQAYGWHEPYESRGSRTDLWGSGGEIPPVYPAALRKRQG